MQYYIKIITGESLQSTYQQFHLNLSNEFLMLQTSVELEIHIAVALFSRYFGVAAYICVEMK